MRQPSHAGSITLKIVRRKFEVSKMAKLIWDFNKSAPECAAYSSNLSIKLEILEFKSIHRSRVLSSLSRNHSKYFCDISKNRTMHAMLWILEKKLTISVWEISNFYHRYIFFQAKFLFGINWNFLNCNFVNVFFVAFKMSKHMRYVWVNVQIFIDWSDISCGLFGLPWRFNLRLLFDRFLLWMISFINRVLLEVFDMNWIFFINSSELFLIEIIKKLFQVQKFLNWMKTKILKNFTQQNSSPEFTQQILK